MDTFLWGTIMWNLLYSIARSLTIEYSEYVFNMDIEKRMKLATLFRILLQSLKSVLPCIYCRRSYRIYILELPPPENSEYFLEWLWIIHEKVNDKLSKGKECRCSKEKFINKTMLLTGLLDPLQFWDLLTILALNFPKNEIGEEKILEQGEDPKIKKRDYHIFFRSLYELLEYVPELTSIRNYIDIRCNPDKIMAERSNFFEWIVSSKFLWAKDQGKSKYEIASISFSNTKLLNYILCSI